MALILLDIILEYLGGGPERRYDFDSLLTPMGLVWLPAHHHCSLNASLDSAGGAAGPGNMSNSDMKQHQVNKNPFSPQL